jgi:hypothetical protein
VASETHTERPSITISGALAGFRPGNHPPVPPLPREAPQGPPPPRTRAAGNPDAVAFTAACPACGRDCVWSEEREDTRVHVAVTCPCG